MGDGLISPASNALTNRGKQIDDAVDAATATPKPAAPPAPTPVTPPLKSSPYITPEQAAADQRARQAKWAADDAAAAGLPKPGLLDRAKAMLGF